MNSLRSVSSLSERQLPGAARPSIRVRSERVGPLLGKRPLQSSPLGDGFQGRCDPFWRAAWKDTQPAASDALLQHSAQDRKPAIESGLARNQPGANLVPIRRTRRQAAEATPPLEGPRLPPFPHALPTSHPHIAHIAPWIEETER